MPSTQLDALAASHTTSAQAPRAAKLVLRMLNQLTHGQLRLSLPDQSQRSYGTATDGAPSGDMAVRDWAVFGAILRGGDIAFAEAFMDGRITTLDLPALLKVMVANRSTIEKAIYGTWWGSLLDRITHLLRANTKQQARKNIAAHYDLGNDFYTLWLDASMTYSAALFGNADPASAALDEPDLARAQQAKYARVLAELALPAQASVLEIGCGWGGFASRAAAAGHRSTGLTLSTEQLAYANARLAGEGVAELVNLKLQDYRDEGAATNTAAQYDGVASIEMFEAVGEAYWPSYFECVARNLKSGGKACVQTIVIRNELFDRYRRGTDFIQRYIFPGGMLPSPEKFAELAQGAGLRVINSHAFGLDYARTLAVWRIRFLRELAHVRAQGYPDRFIRMWEFYLAYCEAGFVGGDIDVVQFTLEK